MVWGAFSRCGTAGSYFLPPASQIKGSRHVELVRKKLEMHMNIHPCSFHARLCSTSSLEGCETISFRKKAATLRWPRKSPDLNSIENL